MDKDSYGIYIDKKAPEIKSLTAIYTIHKGGKCSIVFIYNLLYQRILCIRFELN
jgi:hypothetical protein